MKRINEYKKLFSVEEETDLKQLKKTYRNLVKEWHPDKFQAGDEKALEAEDMSRQVIDGYHFLVSTTYEYFGVSKKIYVKLINSDKQVRFAKRSIFNSFPYRKSKKDLQPA